MTSVAEAPTVQRRLLAQTGHGPLPTLDASQVVGLARDAGLTGRGGSGFPLWRKLNAVLVSGRPPTIIANGAEGEPASGKDKALLTYQPHLVLDGLQLIARAARASTAYLYVAQPAAFRAVLGSRRDPIPVTLVTAPDAFVAGEESAVAAAVAGRGAVPADKRFRLPDTGTLVQNVETLAHLALIARYGAGWFRTAGTYDEPGTFLATIGGAVAAPGVVEAGYGVPLGDLITAAGGPTAPLAAVLVGGYHGAWVPADPALPISREALSPYGATPGAGVVTALPLGACGLAETARIAGYLADQSAGQCGPCVNGLPRLATTLADLAAFRARPTLPAEVTRLTHLVTGRGACRHPDGTARLIASAMRAFSADVTAHLNGHCLATHTP
ncbi:hypothetical protein Ade02nite_02590 [Paractinoplanes deccanensis]|uniref:NADH-ubiquinone oxidoreductase 51kDa subunit iron-sulphur binding domain-containing protein n=1 Tax=Paractinoplanes deccanensis TaxID=113561 RepID=A0ABQ3XV61_9ACTN|nr:NADH-ubiquinone oxidoreductase-F iron-sulfur binding region domain-containing protein [Actinoplanes deccanensis]GID71618.1 hypothetical protein Ade02nite_02590 [Actinoplanes deccanensis]